MPWQSCPSTEKLSKLGIIHVALEPDPTIFSMRKLSLLFFVHMFFGLHGQNLVPNPGFENHLGCPTLPGQFRLVENWFSTGTGSPDYFNDCSPSMDYGTEFNFKGGQVPYEGHAYMGFQSENLHHNEFYEYLETRLTEPLNARQGYCIRAFICRGKSTDALPEIGAVLSVTQVKSSSSSRIRLPSVSLRNHEILADTLIWMCISVFYRAKGGEQFLTLGDFSLKDTFYPVERDPVLDSTFMSAYYFIDDVSVEVTDSASECACSRGK